MYYRVILTRNGKFKKTVKKYKTKKFAFNTYWELKEESDQVMFPKKYINYDKITKVEYELFIVKDREEKDEDRVVRNEMGRLVKEKPLFGKYTILHRTPYYMEETFWVYGYDKNKERKTIQDIIPILMKGLNTNSKMIRNVITVHNKLIIYDENIFEMVICKCLEDSQRVQQKLRDAAIENRLHKKILFLGTASKKTTSDMYEMIVEETGWPIEKVRRRKTKP